MSYPPGVSAFGSDQAVQLFGSLMEKLRASHLARPRMRNAHDVLGLLPGDFFATQEQTTAV
jgi:hypothetical protein